MAGRVARKDWLVIGLALCGIGLERLLSAHLVGPFAADLWIRLGTGLYYTGIGLGLIITWLWRGGASGWLGQARR
jgi:hypothetical protein